MRRPISTFKRSRGWLQVRTSSSTTWVRSAIGGSKTPTTSANDGKATAVNSSFGGCESSDVSFDDSTNSIAEQGAAEGVEFSASSGDSGSNECSGSKGVSAPAGDPYFSSIGGIDFTDTNQGVLETVVMGNVSGYSGGGGVSTVFALPSYQSGITGMITTGRNQPDFSLPFYPVAVYTGGAWGEFLGTSWSSPASVALVLETNELHATKLGVDGSRRSTRSSRQRGTAATTRRARPVPTARTRVTLAVRPSGRNRRS